MLTALETDKLDQVETIESSSRQAWIVVFCASLFFFYEFIQMNMFNTISPDLMKTFSLNAAQLGDLSVNYFYANVIFFIPAGYILDRLSTRKVILTSLFICVVGTFLFATSNNLQLEYVYRFLTGIGSAFCFLSCIRLASRWFPSKRMALVSGLIVTMAMTGGMVAQTPLSLLTENLGWRHAVMIDAALGAIIFVIIYMVVRDFPQDKNNTSKKSSPIKIPMRDTIHSSYLSLQNYLCAFYTCIMNLPVAFLGALWGQLYLEQVHHLSATDASMITSMVFLGAIIGSPCAGWLSDKMRRRRLPMLLGTLITLAIALFVIYTPALHFSTLFVAFFALGLFSSSQVISYPTVAESCHRNFTASSVSIVSLITIGGGYAVAQPLLGALMDWHWNGLVINHQAIYSAANFHTALSIIPLSCLVALVAIFFIRETYCKPYNNNH